MAMAVTKNSAKANCIQFITLNGCLREIERERKIKKTKHRTEEKREREEKNHRIAE